MSAAALLVRMLWIRSSVLSCCLRCDTRPADLVFDPTTAC
jgi:hypothetical protein